MKFLTSIRAPPSCWACSRRFWDPLACHKTCRRRAPPRYSSLDLRQLSYLMVNWNDKQVTTCIKHADDRLERRSLKKFCFSSHVFCAAREFLIVNKIKSSTSDLKWIKNNFFARLRNQIVAPESKTVKREKMLFIRSESAIASRSEGKYCCRYFWPPEESFTRCE